MTFGEKVKNLRKNKGLNQTQLADAVGVSLRTVRGWEIEGRYPKKHDLYQKLADILSCDISYLMTEEEAFITEAEMLNANMISAINSLKMKIPNRIFHEWCNTLIQCQSDRNMMNTLTFTVQKFSDMRIVQTELEAIINEPKREAFAMMFLVLCNIPLLYVLNQNWFETLIFTLPGKITLAICAAVILFSFTRIMQLSKPIEYKG